MASQSNPEMDATELAIEQANAITSHNQVASPLLRLPPELRNKIYDFALTVDCIHVVPMTYGVIYMDKLDFRIKLSNKKYTDAELHVLFCLPATCYQIRAETRLLPYTLNTFELQCEDMKEFEKVLPEHVKQVVRVLRVLWCDRNLGRTTWDQFHWACQRLPKLEKIVFLPTVEKYQLEEGLREDFGAWMAEKVGRGIEFEYL